MKLSLVIERYSPCLLAVAAPLVHWLWFEKVPVVAGELMSDTLNLSGISVGFLAAGQAMLYSMPENFVVSQIKKAGRFDELLRFFTIAIWACLVLALMCMIIRGAGVQEDNTWFRVWMAVSAFAASSTIRVLAIFSVILHK